MKRREELDVNGDTVKKTLIRFAFPIDDETNIFLAQKHVIGMLACFLHVNNTLVVKSGVTGETWKALNDIPTGSAFTESFAIAKRIPPKKKGRLLCLSGS